MRRGVPLVALATMLLLPASATIYQFDDARPALSINGSPVRWNSGSASQLILSSLLIRAHPRGLMSRPQHWHLRDLSNLDWDAHGCVPTSQGLCEKVAIPLLSSIMFPSHQAPIVGQDWADACPSSTTGRVVTNTSRYDASACDVLDTGWDYFYVDSTIWRSQTELPSWVYWTVCVLVVYLVRCLSKYVLASLDKKSGGTPDPFLCLCACSACAVLIIIQGDHCFITEEDLLFHRFNVLYILAYASLFVGARAARAMRVSSHHDPPFYNLLAGVLQLVASRLYVGAETPYNPPLIFVVAVRALVKSRREVDLLRSITLILDAFMLALMCSLGFAPDSMYMVALFAGALAWTDFLI